MTDPYKEAFDEFDREVSLDSIVHDDADIHNDEIKSFIRTHFVPRSFVREVMKLLEYAVCPECDGSGATQISEDEIRQCQWCDEKKKAQALLGADVSGKETV